MIYGVLHKQTLGHFKFKIYIEGKYHLIKCEEKNQIPLKILAKATYLK